MLTAARDLSMQLFFFAENIYQSLMLIITEAWMEKYLKIGFRMFSNQPYQQKEMQ